jgi:hypothetical protein
LGSQATNYNNQPLGLRGAQKIIEEALPRSGLTNEHTRLYILRHSRATYLAKHLTEAQMCVFFGWEQGTKIVRRYLHLSGKDVDETLLAITEGQQARAQKSELAPMKCKRCSETISPTMNFCSRCSLPVILDNEYTREMELEKENTMLRDKYEQEMRIMSEKYEYDIQNIREEMEYRFLQLVTKIDMAKLT